MQVCHCRLPWFHSWLSETAWKFSEPTTWTMKDNERHRWSQAAKDLFEEREEAKIMFGDIVRGQIGWFRKVARVELSLDAIWRKTHKHRHIGFHVNIGYWILRKRVWQSWITILHIVVYDETGCQTTTKLYTIHQSWAKKDEESKSVSSRKHLKTVLNWF